jgi:hypothetical protein
MNEAKLHEFMGKVVTHLGGAWMMARSSLTTSSVGRRGEHCSLASHEGSAVHYSMT